MHRSPRATVPHRSGLPPASPEHRPPPEASGPSLPLVPSLADAVTASCRPRVPGLTAPSKADGLLDRHPSSTPASRTESREDRLRRLVERSLDASRRRCCRRPRRPASQPWSRRPASGGCPARTTVARANRSRRCTAGAAGGDVTHGAGRRHGTPPTARQRTTVPPSGTATQRSAVRLRVAPRRPGRAGRRRPD
jgi:hypothetical protein